MTYLILGRRELGKTTLAWSMLTMKTAEGDFALPYIVAIDPRRMIRQRDHRIEYVRTLGDAGDAIEDMFAGGTDVRIVVYQPIEDDLESAFEGFIRVLKRTMIEHPDDQIGILIDEASFYDLMLPTFQWLLKCLPRDQAYIVITAHQPKDVPTNVRAIADHWYVFYTSQQTDLDRIAEKSPQAASLAKTLKDRAFVHWDDTSARLEVNTKPSAWYVPLEN